MVHNKTFLQSNSCFEVTRGKINKFHSSTNTLFPIQRRARALSTLGRLITINYGNINTLVSDKFAYRSPRNNLFLRFAYPQVKNGEKKKSAPREHWGEPESRGKR